MSHSYGPIFAPPRTAPKAPPPTQGGTSGNGNSGGMSTSTSRKRAAKRKATTAATQPLARTGPGCNAILKLVEDHASLRHPHRKKICNIEGHVHRHLFKCQQMPHVGAILQLQRQVPHCTPNRLQRVQTGMSITNHAKSIKNVRSELNPLVAGPHPPH
jgi:hypothetical protein